MECEGEGLNEVHPAPPPPTHTHNPRRRTIALPHRNRRREQPQQRWLALKALPVECRRRLWISAVFGCPARTRTHLRVTVRQHTSLSAICSAGNTFATAFYGPLEAAETACTVWSNCSEFHWPRLYFAGSLSQKLYLCIKKNGMLTSPRLIPTRLILERSVHPPSPQLPPLLSFDFR